VPAPIIHTIGHSTRPLQSLLELLGEHGIRQLVDVRTLPKSRFNPQYNAAALARSLPERDIVYRPFQVLGGLRQPRPNSPNLGWRHAGFRGFADYMQTPAFAAALIELMALAEAAATAIMCAEAEPERCHRGLIADALLVRGLAVRHITGPGEAHPHQLTPFAKIDGLGVTYPAAEPDLFAQPPRAG
jgi:uncharacterized protein (DUF488 family)